MARPKKAKTATRDKDQTLPAPAADSTANLPVPAATTPEPQPENPPKPPKTPIMGKYPRWVYPTVAATAVITGGATEMHTSFLQSRVFHAMAEGRLFARTRTSSPTVAAPAVGPYDERLGYTQSLRFRQRMTERGYQLTGETTWTERSVLGMQLYPIYNSRSQAGLTITDDTNYTVYSAQYPSRSFENFDNIPPMLVNSLLFVENRELMKDHVGTWNPAIEWVRLASAFAGQGLRFVGMPQDRAGGSTLATQIEKFRHSRGGVTSGATDKLRQMLTATVRAYEDGPDTTQARHRIVLDYFNSMPLAAYPGFGEVNGFADGMSLWFGADMREVNRLLRTPDSQLSEADLQHKAEIYRQSLSLVMSVKKPTAYLRRNHAELTARVDAYLPLLAEAGIISPQMRDRVLRTPLTFVDPANQPRLRPAPPSKPVQSMRIDLMRSLGVSDLYALNRLDVSARTTMDGRVNDAVTTRLRNLRDPQFAAQNGMLGFRLLNPSMTQNVVYSFNLYERLPDGTNVLRVQTDNYDGALNLNSGSRLELGSTAKIRTLATYLEIITEIRAQNINKTPDQLRATRKNDVLTQWTVNYLLTPGNDTSLDAMLHAAMQRQYSGNPGENFWTGGGVHHFQNFDGWENGRNFTVSEAFKNSVNLPFVRILRDVRDYMEAEKMNIDPSIFTDPASPQRRQYLERFAQQEGALFMYRAWTKLQDKSPEDMARQLASQTRRTPTQLAVIYRSLFPNRPLADMEAFVRAECQNGCATANFQKLYDNYARDKFNLNDRAYLTRLHPMAIWIAEQRIANPNLTWDQALQGSAQTRIDIYGWLLNSKNMNAQNNRIRTMLEEEAFTHIHGYWKRMGFPFDRMTPSLGSALGASGDTPAALATLAGIIQNDGMMRDATSFREVTLARGTPYELDFRRPTPPATRVLPAEAARIIHDTMLTVVDGGTAVRARNSVHLSDGRVLPLGGKTGTGDNREGDVVKSRTATFVFVIDNRFYGTITAFVEGPAAAHYGFTSSLAAQLFKTIVPDIQPILDRSYTLTPNYPAPAPLAGAPAPVAPAPAPAAPAAPATPPAAPTAGNLTASAAPRFTPPAAAPRDTPLIDPPQPKGDETPATGTETATTAPKTDETPAAPAPVTPVVTTPVTPAPETTAPAPAPTTAPETATPAAPTTAPATTTPPAGTDTPVNAATASLNRKGPQGPRA